MDALAVSVETVVTKKRYIEINLQYSLKENIDLFLSM